MVILPTKFEDVKLIETIRRTDARGFFMESYNYQDLKKHGIDLEFIQDNHSKSIDSGVIRGIHYQLSPKAQSKLFRVTSGAVYDVVVDLRKKSPTFGHWTGFILTSHNNRQLLVPKGFGHGFCTLVPNTEVQYKVDAEYSPEHERGIIWNDPALAIDWPTSDPILSDKDRTYPVISEAEYNF